MNSTGWRKLFLFIIGISVLGYTFYTVNAYREFTQLDTTIPLENITWDVFSKDEETHLYTTTYSYNFDGKHYEGEYLFKKPVFINVLGAKHALNEFSQEYQNVWISSEHPDHSALEKSYPAKELVYTALLWVIVAYFLLLPK
jgi:hypothetical protein